MNEEYYNNNEEKKPWEKNKSWAFSSLPKNSTEIVDKDISPQVIPFL